MESYTRKFTDFKQKTCRKIAELTEVVHVLFVQNQGKDELLNRLRDEFSNYECIMQNELEELRRNSKQYVMSEKDKQILMQEVKRNFQAEESRIKEHYEELMNVISKQLSASLQDQTKLQHNNELLKKQFDELSMEKSQIESRNDVIKRQQEQHLEEVRCRLLSMERAYESALKDKQNYKQEQRTKREKMRIENAHQTAEMTQFKQQHSRLGNKCSELEMELTGLNEQLRKHKTALLQLQASEANSSNIEKIRSTQNSDQTRDSWLERELQKYKLELSNRDRNFSRLFTNNSVLRVAHPKRPNMRRHSTEQSGNSDFSVSMAISTRCQPLQSEVGASRTVVKVVSAQYREKECQLPTITK